MYKVMQKSFYLTCSLLSLSLTSTFVLSSNHVVADDDTVTDVSITVPIACTMQGTGTVHTAILNPGTYSGTPGSEYENGIGKTTLTAICNDDNGFSIYAIGFTGNSYEDENHTKLVGNNTGSTIATKEYISGDTASSWSMKLAKVANPTESYNPENLTLQNAFDSWHTIPNVYTKVAEYKANTGSSTTDLALGVKLETTYAAFIASNQVADTYVGQVRYTMVHPYNAREPEPPYFQVFYTGRPLSTEEGHENPIKIRMSELPASGKYNLLGTDNGSFDKLTPGTLYGGYSKASVDLLDTFNYSNESTVYDGTNFDWSTLSHESVDATSITPENASIYLVKEVPTGYLQNYDFCIYNPNSGILADLYLFTAVDDGWYNGAGIEVNGEPRDTKVIRSYTFTGVDGTTKITPEYAFGDKGVVDTPKALLIRTISSDYILSAGTYVVIPFWITFDQYKVTGSTSSTIELPDLVYANIGWTDEEVGSTITKYEPESEP